MGLSEYYIVIECKVIPLHTMRAYRGRRGIALPIIDFDTRWREACRQTSHTSCLTHGKNPGTHATGSWLVPRAGLGYFGEEKTSTRIRTTDHPARSYSLYGLHYPTSLYIMSCNNKVNLLWQYVSMIIGVWQLIQEGPRLQNKGGEHHFWEVHAWSDLLHEVPDERLVFLSKLFYLLPCLHIIQHLLYTNRTSLYTNKWSTVNSLPLPEQTMLMDYTWPKQIFYRAKSHFHIFIDESKLTLAQLSTMP